MKLSTVLTNPYDGEELTHKDKLLDVRLALFLALNYDGPELRQTGDDKFKAWMLMQRIIGTDEINNLTSEEKVFIKQRLAIVWAAIAYGQMVDLLEPKA